jgi:hypothetical protein
LEQGNLGCYYNDVCIYGSLICGKNVFREEPRWNQFWKGASLDLYWQNDNASFVIHNFALHYNSQQFQNEESFEAKVERQNVFIDLWVTNYFSMLVKCKVICLGNKIDVYVFWLNKIETFMYLFNCLTVGGWDQNIFLNSIFWMVFVFSLCVYLYNQKLSKK